MMVWYKFFTYLVYPFIPIYLYFRKFKKKESLASINEKQSKINIKRDKGFLVWMHMASVGETMSVLPLIDIFINDKKIDKILLTTVTLSSEKIIKKKFNKNQKVVHQFLPLDVPIIVKKFLTHWHPSISIFIDSEIWPNIISQIKLKKIPLLLINARITKKTFNRWVLLKKFSKNIFEKFDLCLASNKESEIYLNTLGAKNIKNYGNLKFSNIKDIINDNNQNFKSSFIDQIKNRKIWCASSTHLSEEVLCAEAHKKIKKSYNNVLTIIIPRHINRVDDIYKKLSNLNLKVAIFSKLEKVNTDLDIILINSYGEALKFYKISKCVFLGKSLIGSLAKDSGQNPIEPARVGCKILHGPNISNFIEIYKYLHTLGVTKQILSSEDIGVAVINEFEENIKKNDTIVKKIENYGQSILNNVTKEIEKYI